MLGHASNPELQKAEQEIQSKVKPEFQSVLGRYITAGLNILYAPQLSEGLQHRIATSHNPPQDAGKGATRMTYELYTQGKGKMPPEILTPTAMIMAFEFLDLLDKAGKAKITPQLIAETTQATGEAMLEAMKMTPDKIQSAVAQKKSATAPRGIIASAQGA